MSTINVLRARYTPPSIPGRVVVGLAVAFAGLTILRGIGWILAKPRRDVSLVVMDALASRPVWGGILAASGLLVLAAYASRVHTAVWAAHGLTCAVYLCITITITQSVAAIGGGWQHIAAPLGGVLWHLLMAVLTGPLPPRGAPRVTD